MKPMTIRLALLELLGGALVVAGAFTALADDAPMTWFLAVTGAALVGLAYRLSGREIYEAAHSQLLQRGNQIRALTDWIEQDLLENPSLDDERVMENRARMAIIEGQVNFGDEAATWLLTELRRPLWKWPNRKDIPPS